MPFCIGNPDYGTQATDYVDALQKLIAFVDEDNNYVATMAVNAGGSGWAVDDYFELDTGTEAQGLKAVGKVTAVSSGAVTAIEIASMGAYSADPTATGGATAAVSPSSGTGLTIDATVDSLGYVVELDQVYDTTERECFLQAPGLDDAQNIYFGIRTYRDVPADVYNWEIVGATGYNGALDWDAQPGSDADVYFSSGLPSVDVPAWNTTLPYWFYVNKQRISVIMRPAATYQHGYAGFGLPFGPLSLYPYPLFWSGMAQGGNSVRYSVTTTALSGALDPDGRSGFFRWVDGSNYPVDNTETDNPNMFPHDNQWSSLSIGESDPSWSQGTFISSLDWLTKLRDNGGEYPLIPIVAWNEEQFVGYIMQLDRTYFVPGFSLAAEDEITVNGTKYRVFQNGFRTSVDQFIAIEEV